MLTIALILIKKLIFIKLKKNCEKLKMNYQILNKTETKILDKPYYIGQCHIEYY